MEIGILITQCLQNDFVKPIGKYEKLPNLLHVGYREALRLMGEDTESSPVNLVVRWAYSLPEEELAVIHIRDWHDQEDSFQEKHLHQFGSHCIKNSPGAEFVFEKNINKGRKQFVINATGLNDFIGTNMKDILDRFNSFDRVKIGIMGVWTEAKVQFLAYDILSRYPHFEVGICSALTAGSSRSMHFITLDQLKNILGVKIFSSVGEFTSFLGGSVPEVEPRFIKESLELNLANPEILSEIDRDILGYLFRECRSVDLKCLDGGFSGNIVLKARGVDKLGRKQVSSVVKIGPAALMGKERMAFEKIEEVMGNNAPAIVDYVEISGRGGIKYRYASMMDENVRTFQSVYEESFDMDKIGGYLDMVFKNHLGRLYESEDLEKQDLLEYYDFKEKYAPHIKKNIEALESVKIDGDTIEILPGTNIEHPVIFYEKDLKEYSPCYPEQHFMAFVHGDLNGKNIIIDGQSNVWLIDFFHTHRGHILRDLIKLENDLLFIFTKIKTPEELKEAFSLTDWLLSVKDLGKPLSPPPLLHSKELQKAGQAVLKLRSFHPPLIRSDRDPYQLYVTFLRYAMHTLSFDECTELQKHWALYTGAVCISYIRAYLRQSRALRIDFISPPGRAGKLGLTLLPGRLDRNRSLKEDLSVLKEENITRVLCLVTPLELDEYGVPCLLEAYENAGLKALHFPILDQMAPQRVEIVFPVFDWIEEALTSGENVLIHCVGGLGRSGLIAAGYLKKICGLESREAIELVRKARSTRALETASQEAFVERV